MVLKKKSLGFVPTMGALHEGHLALMGISKRENDVTAASIFVNPTQFSRGEDLDKYPRPLGHDIEMLTAGKIDLLFLPNGRTMYRYLLLMHTTTLLVIYYSHTSLWN
jgi:pantoate--beta-alanine ligase